MPHPGVITHWSQSSNPAVVSASVLGTFLTSAKTTIVNAQVIHEVAAGTSLTLAGNLVPEACARCLVVFSGNVNSGAARGAGRSVRVIGTNQWGERVEEVLTFSANWAINVENYMYTRWAYRTVSAVQVLATGTTVAGDNLSVGVVGRVATLPGSGEDNLQTGNGAAAGRFKGIGLPIPVSSGTNALGAASAGFESEIMGVTLENDTNTQVNTIVRTAPYLVDTVYHVYVPNEVFVASGSGIFGIFLNVVSKRGA